jgi:hypothetical protein
LGRRVVTTATYDFRSRHLSSAALLQDVAVHLPEGRVEFSHVWLQHSEALGRLERGQRFSAACEVIAYRRTDGSGATAYALAHPVEVVLLCPTAYRPGATRRA